MIARAGSGHIGSSFSSLDIMSWLLLYEIRVPAEGDATSVRDIFFSSKGHDAPGLYSAYIGLGRLNFDLIHTLRKLGGLPGHPDIGTPNIVTNSVPTIAFAIPPPDSPTGAGMRVKNAQLSEVMPWLTT